MTLAHDIHQLVLAMDGVATVYSPDPVWLAAVKRVAARVVADSPEPLCLVEWENTDDGARPAVCVQLRIGSVGTVPTPDLLRSVAARIRELVSAQHPEADVKVVAQVSAIGI